MNHQVSTCAAAEHAHCSLCGDEALAGRVLSVDIAGTTAEVSVSGVTQTVALDLVDGVTSGMTVLVHQGFAISVECEASP